MHGRHFVLMIGFDSKDLNKWYIIQYKYFFFYFYKKFILRFVNDPGFNISFYHYNDIVGYRIFDIK